MRGKPWRRPILPADNVGTTCSCLECRAADVTHLRLIRVPPDQFCVKRRWLHGEELRVWYEARDRAMAAARDAVKGSR
jgi:hypothetical protein